MKKHQEAGKTITLVATQVRPNWAQQICDDYGHGLEWASEVSDEGVKTGEISCKCLWKTSAS